jgi:UDP-3-O-[3-hydroxymyristoyl] glucosamine N-acyltransferase
MVDLSFFTKTPPISLKELAAIGGCTIHNNNDINKLISGVAPIDSATEYDITFLSNSKYSSALFNSDAYACILDDKSIKFAPEHMCLLISKNPYSSYAKIAAAFYKNDRIVNCISEKAIIAKTAVIGNDCNIEAGAFIGEDATIGNNCHIAANAYIGNNVIIGNNCFIGHACTITHSRIGCNVIIHPGARLGQDGFGFASENGVHIKIPQVGRVIIEDYVEIGANTTIDRGSGPDTVIGNGTKIDNLVQIAHNVEIGKGCVIAAQTGISGSSKLGDYVVLGGQVGIAGHLNIGNMVHAAAKSGIINDFDSKEVVGGYPAVSIRDWHRQSITLKKLISNKGNSDE